MGRGRSGRARTATPSPWRYGHDRARPPPSVAGSRLDLDGLERPEHPMEAAEPGLVLGHNDDLGAGAAKVTNRTAGGTSVGWVVLMGSPL